MNVTIRQKPFEKEELLKKAMNIKFLTGVVSRQLKDCFQPKMPFRPLPHLAHNKIITLRRKQHLESCKNSVQTSASSSFSTTRAHSAQKCKKISIKNPQEHIVIREHLSHLNISGGAYTTNWRNSSSNISRNMRVIMGQWLMQVALELQIPKDAVYNALHYTDKYVGMVEVPKNLYQCVGLCAFFIASKLELSNHPNIFTFLEAIDNNISREQLVALQQKMVLKLKFKLNPPTLHQYMLLLVSLFNNYIAKFNVNHPKITSDSNIYKDLFWMLDGVHLENDYKYFHSKQKVCLGLLFLAVKKQKYPQNRVKLFMDLQHMKILGEIQKIFQGFLSNVVQIFKKISDIHDCICFFRKWVKYDRLRSTPEQQITELKRIIIKG